MTRHHPLNIDRFFLYVHHSERIIKLAAGMIGLMFQFARGRGGCRRAPGISSGLETEVLISLKLLIQTVTVIINLWIM